MSEQEFENWQRLSAWSVLFFVAGFLRSVITNLLALVPFVYGLMQIRDMSILVAVVVLVCCAIVLFAFLQYRNYRYRIDVDAVLVRQGVLFKKQINLGFERVQNISLEHAFYFRPLGLVTVNVDSAGSSSDEVHLSALTGDRAEEIYATIQAGRALAQESARGETAQKVEEVSPQRFLISRGLPDLILHGLTNNRAWLILGAVAAGVGQFADQIGVYVSELGIDVGEYLSNQSLAALAVLFVTAFLLSLVLVALLSVVSAVVSFYKYELYGSEESFTVRRGLLIRHVIHMKKTRVQDVYFRQDWLDRVLGRVNLIFEQLSSDKQLVVPTVTIEQAERLAREAIETPDLKSLSYTSASPRLFYRNLLISLILSLLLIVILTVLPLPDWIVLPALVLPVTVATILYWSWRRIGLAVTGDLAVVRRGVFGIDYVVMELHKMQKGSFTQTPGLRKHGLATLVLTVASRSIKVPFLPAGFARQVLDLGLYEVESSQRSWM